MVAFTKKNTITPAVLDKLSAKPCTRTADSQLPPNCTDADHSSDDDREEEEQHGHLIMTTTPASYAHPSLNTHSSPSMFMPYSLTFGPLSTRKRQPPIPSSSSRKRSYPQRAAPSPSSSSPSTSTSAYHTSPQEEISSIHPSDHMKTLLTQLASSIAALKAATSLKALASGVCHCADDTYSKAQRQSMEREVRALSDVHLRLYSLVQEQNFGQSYETSSIDRSMGPNSQNSAERQEMLLRSYEGVIVRFHDEMRKQDAVAEALKETLARSMLKGEKLERRVKALEAFNKLSPVQPKPKQALHSR